MCENPLKEMSQDHFANICAAVGSYIDWAMDHHKGASEFGNYDNYWMTRVTETQAALAELRRIRYL